MEVKIASRLYVSYFLEIGSGGTNFIDGIYFPRTTYFAHTQCCKSPAYLLTTQSDPSLLRRSILPGLHLHGRLHSILSLRRARLRRTAFGRRRLRILLLGWCSDSSGARRRSRMLTGSGGSNFILILRSRLPLLRLLICLRLRHLLLSLGSPIKYRFLLEEVAVLIS